MLESGDAIAALPEELVAPKAAFKKGMYAIEVLQSA